MSVEKLYPEQQDAILELQDAIDNGKQDLLDQLIDGILDMLISRGFFIDQILWAIGGYVGKKFDNNAATLLIEEARISFQVIRDQQEKRVVQSTQSDQPDEESTRQQYEGFLSELEAAAVHAIASNDWSAFYTRVGEFQNGQEELNGSPD